MRPSYQQFLTATGQTDDHDQHCTCDTCRRLHREFREHIKQPATHTRVPTDDEVTEAVKTR